jgi:N-acetylmuramoyl-L-alanine amidase
MTTFLSRAEVHPNPDRHGGYFLGVHRQPYLVQHHTPGQDPTTYNEALEEYYQIYNGHVGNGWNDFGYNFLIWDQYIFEGRGFGWTGAHAPGANSQSLGVAFIMDGRYRIPTSIEYAAFHDLSKAALTYGYLSLTFELTGHRDWVSTACPGDLCYAHLNDFWTPTTQPPLPFPTGKDSDVYDFQLRPDPPLQWNHNGINYVPLGGAAVYDFHDVKVGDHLVVSSTTETVGDVVFNLLYSNGKQTEARALRFGQPAKFEAEQAGFVSVLCEIKGGGKLRVTGERKA